MATMNERLLKAESDVRYAQYIALRNKGAVDYNIMMGNIEDPSEGEEETDGAFTEL